MEDKKTLLIKEIINDKRYRIESDGSIWSFSRHRVYWRKIANSGPNGYRVVVYKKTALYAHRIVYQKFLGSLDARLVINHRDGNKSNNSVSNLEQVSIRDNNEHALKAGLSKPIAKLFWKSKRGRAILSKRKGEFRFLRSKISAVVDLIDFGCTPLCIAKRLKISKQRVHQIRDGFFGKEENLGKFRLSKKLAPI